MLVDGLFISWEHPGLLWEPPRSPRHAFCSFLVFFLGFPPGWCWQNFPLGAHNYTAIRFETLAHHRLKLSSFRGRVKKLDIWLATWRIDRPWEYHATMSNTGLARADWIFDREGGAARRWKGSRFAHFKLETPWSGVSRRRIATTPSQSHLSLESGDWRVWRLESRRPDVCHETRLVMVVPPKLGRTLVTVYKTLFICSSVLCSSCIKSRYSFNIYGQYINRQTSVDFYPHTSLPIISIEPS